VVFAQELMPGRVGLASGLILGLAIGVGGMGAALMGRVADLWGLSTIFNFMAVLPAVGLLLTIFLPERGGAKSAAKPVS